MIEVHLPPSSLDSRDSTVKEEGMRVDWYTSPLSGLTIEGLHPFFTTGGTLLGQFSKYNTHVIHNFICTTEGPSML